MVIFAGYKVSRDFLPRNQYHALNRLLGLQSQYTARRDYTVDCLADEFDLRAEANACDANLSGCGAYTAYPKSENLIMTEEKISGEPLFSFIPPASGMYMWVGLHAKENHLMDPNYVRVAKASSRSPS